MITPNQPEQFWCLGSWWWKAILSSFSDPKPKTLESGSDSIVHNLTVS